MCKYSTGKCITYPFIYLVGGALEVKTAGASLFSWSLLPTGETHKQSVRVYNMIRAKRPMAMV